MPVINARDFAEAAGLLEEFVDLETRLITYNTWTELVDHTPVCSGKAAFSWFVRPDGPETKDELPTPPRPSSPVDCQRIYGDPRSTGRYRGGSQRFFPEYPRFTKRWFISNPIDYLNKLNAGSSQKAPSGFIEKAIASARSST